MNAPITTEALLAKLKILPPECLRSVPKRTRRRNYVALR